MVIGQNPDIMKIKKLIREVAKTNDNALIIGEVGTGKKLAAQEIHRRSKQKNKSFVIINCSAVGDTITEADLYGQKIEGPRGVERKIGLLEQAKRGILYLENINDLSNEYQQKFFNIFSEKKFKKAGSKEFITVDFRIIASSSDPDILKKETIRKDLLSMIDKFILYIPPLRDRKQDIPYLFSHFLEKYCIEFSHAIPPIPPEIFDSLMAYEWNGNVSELKNTVRNLLLMSPEDKLSIEYLPFEIKKHPLEFLEGRDLPAAVGEVEHYLISKALRKFAGNQTKAAKSLNISEAALRYKMKKYRLSKKDF